jgi:hypothetical protein
MWMIVATGCLATTFTPIALTIGDQDRSADRPAQGHETT